MLAVNGKSGATYQIVCTYPVAPSTLFSLVSTQQAPAATGRGLWPTASGASYPLQQK